MNRFFIEKPGMNAKQATLSGDEAKHITRVLRMGVGDEVCLCDGEGMDYRAKIASCTKDSVLFDLLGGAPCETEPNIQVTLFQGLPKAGKMETIIQKCVELGVYEIVPVAAMRSVARVHEKDERNKLVRYNRIAYEAAKQSRRGVVPRVLSVTTFMDADWARFDAVIAAYEEEHENSLRGVLMKVRGAKRIALVIGPEGGLEKSEMESIVRRGGMSVSLGKRILRTETAGMAMLSMLMYELEE